jgi:hypothetical protein
MIFIVHQHIKFEYACELSPPNKITVHVDRYNVTAENYFAVEFSKALKEDKDITISIQTKEMHFKLFSAKQNNFFFHGNSLRRVTS